MLRILDSLQLKLTISGAFTRNFLKSFFFFLGFLTMLRIPKKVVAAILKTFFSLFSVSSSERLKHKQRWKQTFCSPSNGIDNKLNQLEIH